MDIKLLTMDTMFTNRLLSEMNEALEQITFESANTLQRAEKSYLAIQVIIEQLKVYVVEYVFKDMEEEIHFFKEIKPLFIKELIYYTELFYIETNKPVGSAEVIKTYYASCLHRMQVFFERNQYLYLYYRTGRTNHDEVFYRRNSMPDFVLPHCMPEIDTRFSTLHSFKLSKIMAYELLSDCLQHSILRIGQPEEVPEMKTRKRKRIWTATKSALIEMGYALHASGAVNHGQGDLKELMQDLESFFNVRLGNFYRTIQSMRIRKKNRALYLDILKTSLEKYMDDADMRD